MTEFIKLPQVDVMFHASQDEELSFHQRDLIRLFPFGLSLSSENQRPFLLLKDETGVHTLPVAINPLEAGITLGTAKKSALPSTPHRFTSLLMESLGVQALQCVFVQIRGAHQFVRIYLAGHPAVNSLKVKADEAMSLCLHMEIPIYATQSFINQSRVMASEIQGQTETLKRNRHLVIQDHPYIM